MDKGNVLVLVSSPIGFGGGAKREKEVIPRLARLVKERLGMDTIIYIPFNKILWLSRVIYSKHSNINNAIEELSVKLTETTKMLSREVYIDTLILDEMIEEAKNLLNKIYRFPNVMMKALDMNYMSTTSRFKLEDAFAHRFINYLKKLNVTGGILHLEHCASLESVHVGLKIAKFFNMKSSCLLQRVPYMPRKPPIVNTFYTYYTVKSFLHLKRAHNDFISSGSLRQVLSVSIAPFLYYRYFYEYFINKKILIGIPKPSNAFNSNLLKIRKTKNKDEKVAIYFGRLTEEKGLLDLLHVWRLLSSIYPDMKLKLIGSFMSRDTINRFKHIINKYNIKNVEYLGYIEGDRLYEEVSKAKVLVYPSHQDSFSLTVLEALALGTSVVAYDIPALRSIYSGLPPVFLVRRGDIKQMAEYVAKLMLMSDVEYEKLHDNIIVKRFLNMYSSWDNVAKAQFMYLVRLYREGVSS